MMQFGSFTWPNDPARIRCAYRRMVTVTDGAGTWSLSDQGYGGCTVVAEGDLYTAGAATQLTALFKSGGAATLTVPSVGVFQARCTDLVVEQEAVEGCVHYVVTFVEVPGSASEVQVMMN